jgi:hypothetical protein
MSWFAALIKGPTAPKSGIRRVSEAPRIRPNERGADPSTPLVTWCFPSLRGLDLNQRPLGHEAFPGQLRHIR